MLQIIQYQKTGEMLVEELPAPECLDGGILVRTGYSLISAGTEKTSVENAKGSLLERAKKQPEQVKLVMDFVKKEGIVSTYKRVKNKLDSYKTLGYSLSGVVVESRCDEFAPGDRVACGGAGYAVHAEYISVPKNLAVHIPDDVSMEDASYATVGSIAMQGVRQADVRLGETVAVIGLGLLGQITVQLLKAAGCRVIGMDINPDLFETAENFGCDMTCVSSKESIQTITGFTRGVGCDSVIIAASTSSNEPMELAIQIARKKGKVVVVGAVSMNIARVPFYQKELDITISCSYGPGRYDAEYEEKGQDYPVAFVRWTENRNMMSILDLISMGKLDVESLSTHEFEINDAQKAYDVITGKADEKFLGILIKYPERKDSLNRTISLGNEIKPAELKIGFVGLGSFAQNYLMPPILDKNPALVAVSTQSSVNAQTMAQKFGFNYASTDSYDVIRKEETNTIFIASRHDTHAQFVKAAIMAGKPVFVEKPLCIRKEELDDIDALAKKHNARLMVGFNRRFSGSFVRIKEFFEGRSAPMGISYRMNAGHIPKGHWVVDPEQGGRIIGEACHMIDCMVYLTGALPVRVYAEGLSSSQTSIVHRDNLVISIKFSDGSVGSIQYFANGEKSLPKEYCEVFCENSVAIMDNFESVKLFRGSKYKIHKLDGRKGHKEEVHVFLDAVKEGKEMPISYAEISAITRATFAAIESIEKAVPVEV